MTAAFPAPGSPAPGFAAPADPLVRRPHPAAAQIASRRRPRAAGSFALALAIALFVLAACALAGLLLAAAIFNPGAFA